MDVGVSNIVPDYVLQYAPLVWLHSEDPFRPADLSEHVRHTTPMINQEPVPDLPQLDLDNLAILNNITNLGDGRVALTSNDNITSLPSWLLGQTPDSSGVIANVTACVVIVVEKSDVEVDAFYWYFYSYDRGPNITQVVEPWNGIFGDDPPGYAFGDHVGDWEHNMIRFKDGQPEGIYYSQHRDGASYSWDHSVLSKQDGRPLVFSAYGSHANYPSEGDNLHDIVILDHCNTGVLWDPVLSAYAYSLNPTTMALTPLSLPGSQAPTPAGVDSFIQYRGIWGDEQYPDSNPVQQTVPYFGLKRFVSGPTGPIMKPLVRTGLGPDHPRRKVWMEWAVEKFMSWYPCCIRGWKKWMSLSVLLLLPILAFLGIRYALLKRRERNKYTRLETEIPMEDLEASDSSRQSEPSIEDRID